MNVLFIGPYSQGNSGWTSASHDYIKALNTIENINLAIRPIYFTGGTTELTDEFKKLEEKVCDSYDVIVQKVLPHSFQKVENVRSVGLCVLESANLEYTRWPRHALTMDEVWVPSQHNRNSLLNSNVKNSYVVPEPLDLKQFDMDVGPHNSPLLKNNFNFYFIGEYIQRKNLLNLIVAFHCEFNRNEPVNLVIKTNRGGLNEHDLRRQLDEHIGKLKASLRIYRNLDLYKKEIIITNYLDDKDLAALHKSCNCFVIPSRGEAHCRPALDALGHNNFVISTDGIGTDDYIKHKWRIQSVDTPCITNEPPLPYLYTARETWKEPSVCHLQFLMRKAYEQGKLSKEEKTYNRQRIEAHSYENVGKRIMERLNAQ